MSKQVKKANRAEDVIGKGAKIRVQILNEVADVSRQKLNMSWPETKALLDGLRSVYAVIACIASRDPCIARILPLHRDLQPGLYKNWR